MLKQWQYLWVVDCFVKAAAVLAVDDDGGILGIFNNEKPAVRLAADDDGGGLSIYNKQVKP
jgi:hypothetical protein